MDQKNAGVWMDFSSARIIEPFGEPSLVKELRSLTEGQVREDGQGPDGTRLGFTRSTNNEYSKHHVKMEEVDRFFKELAGALLKYESILVFGPGTAHSEFANYLVKDHRFKNRNVSTEVGNYLTEHEQEQKVKNFFYPGREKKQ